VLRPGGDLGPDAGQAGRNMRLAVAAVDWSEPGELPATARHLTVAKATRCPSFHPGRKPVAGSQ